MKKITAGIVLVMFLAFGASAQEKQHGHHGKHKAKHHRGYHMKDLNLSEEQKQKMKAIGQTFRQQMADLNKNESITVKEMRDRRAAIAKEHRLSVEGVLTAEQKAKIQEQKTKSVEKRKEMQANRMEKMKKDLSLTDDQTAKLKSLNENYRNKIESLKKNESLDRTAKKGQLQALRQQHKSELKNVLSEEQIKKLEEMRKDKGGTRHAR